MRLCNGSDYSVHPPSLVKLPPVSSACTSDGILMPSLTCLLHLGLAAKEGQERSAEAT